MGEVCFVRAYIKESNLRANLMREGMRETEKIYCPNCGKMREYEVSAEKETFLVEGEGVSVDADVSYCKICNGQLWNEDLDEENLRKAQEKQRRQKIQT